MTIKLTSAESERAFSAAEFICTKIRTRLNEEIINALSFFKKFSTKASFNSCFLYLSFVINNIPCYFCNILFY